MLSPASPSPSPLPPRPIAVDPNDSTLARNDRTLSSILNSLEAVSNQAVKRKVDPLSQALTRITSSISKTKFPIRNGFLRRVCSKLEELESAAGLKGLGEAMKEAKRLKKQLQTLEEELKEIRAQQADAALNTARDNMKNTILS